MTRPSRINNIAPKNCTETIQNPYRTHAEYAQLTAVSVQFAGQEPGATIALERGATPLFPPSIAPPMLSWKWRKPGVDYLSVPGS